MTDFNCPACSAPRTWGFIFDHIRNACWIGDADETTRETDERELDYYGGEFIRRATPAELALAEVVRGEPFLRRATPFSRPGQKAFESAQAKQTIVTRLARECARRVIAEVSVPDEIPLQEEKPNEK